MHVTHGAARRVKWFRHAAQLKQQQQLRQQLKQCNMCSQYKTELKACQQLGSCEPAVHPPTPLQRWSAQTQTEHDTAQRSSTPLYTTQLNTTTQLHPEIDWTIFICIVAPPLFAATARGLFQLPGSCCCCFHFYDFFFSFGAHKLKTHTKKV